MLKNINYTIQRHSKDFKDDLLSSIKDDIFTFEKENISFEKLENLIYCEKSAYPIEFRDTNLDDIKTQAHYLRKAMVKEFIKDRTSIVCKESIDKYVDFLRTYNTDDCVVMSLRHLRCRSKNYITYNFEGVMTDISNKINTYQLKTMYKQTFETCLINEKKKIESLNVDADSGDYLHYWNMITEKFKTSTKFAPHINLLSRWKENSKQIFRQMTKSYKYDMYFDNIQCVDKALLRYNECINKFNFTPYNICIKLNDARIKCSAPWYKRGLEIKPLGDCIGCDEKSPEFAKHSFDEHCKITCATCKYKLHQEHSTYGRLYCLPTTRRATNRTSLRPWAFNYFIEQLDRNNATFSFVDNYLQVNDMYDEYLAKYILCSSNFDAITFQKNNIVSVFCSNTMSKSFSKISSLDTIHLAIQNSNIRKCKEYPISSVSQEKEEDISSHETNT
tara:strand:- start:4433 stop:5770 length:1338 start_codon:yes stop_codon:yes gene_type:complete